MDKYGPVPGSMDTIDCLRKEIEDLKQEIRERDREIKALRQHHITPAEIEAEMAAKDILDGDQERKSLHIARLRQQIKEKDAEIETLKAQLVRDEDHGPCQSEIFKLQSLIGIERDAFGKMETEMMVKINSLRDEVQFLEKSK